MRRRNKNTKKNNNNKKKGEKRAFMAEPSDRLAINNRLVEKKKFGCEYDNKKNKKK